MDLVVATVGRPHGLRGDVFVDARTDEPEQRFAIGQVLTTDPGGRHLTVAGSRWQNGRWVLRFEEVTDRTQAEALNHVELTIPAADSDEDDAWYSHELVGMAAKLVDGTNVGEIVGIDHGAAHDFLILKEPSGTKTLIPFVSEIVPDVDKATKTVTLNPPGGLLASDADRLVVSDETIGNGEKSVKGKGTKAVNTKTTHGPDFENGGEHRAEEAAELAAPLAPKPGTKEAGEIEGTIEAEDVETHERFAAGYQPENSES